MIWGAGGASPVDNPPRPQLAHLVPPLPEGLRPLGPPPPVPRPEAPPPPRGSGASGSRGPGWNTRATGTPEMVAACPQQPAGSRAVPGTRQMAWFAVAGAVNSRCRRMRVSKASMKARATSPTSPAASTGKPSCRLRCSRFAGAIRRTAAPRAWRGSQVFRAIQNATPADPMSIRPSRGALW